MTSAEQIVRALAARTAPMNRRTGRCQLCGVSCQPHHRTGREHRPSCPWRTAVQWQNLQTRFEAMVDRSPGQGPEGDCHEWTGAPSAKGYGTIYVVNRKERATRVAWLFEHDEWPWPSDLLVLHHCDNPPCVNPAHLFLGTAKDNTHDMIRKGRWRRPPVGETNGRARLTAEQVREIRRLEGTASQTALAQRYGVATRTVCNIINRKTWRTLGDEPQTEGGGQ